jgi:acyl-CoA synthetase (AMP-forming)/AMP-acid ligase II
MVRAQQSSIGKKATSASPRLTMSTKLTIAHYINTLAEQYEDRPAIYFKSAFRTFSYSYRKIYERCLRVANYLSQKGLKKGDRILIWSYNGQEYASILLGCALSGVVAVPIDFSSKADFVALIAEKVRAKHLFNSKRRPFPLQKLSRTHVEDLDFELLKVPITSMRLYTHLELRVSRKVSSSPMRTSSAILCIAIRPCPLENTILSSLCFR